MIYSFWGRFCWPFCHYADKEGFWEASYLPVYLSTRAAHLEIDYSLDTDSFLNAFSKMVTRRGKPEVMISDNHTNFTSAERELRGLVSTLDQTWIKEQVAHDGLQWRFKLHSPSRWIAS